MITTHTRALSYTHTHMHIHTANYTHTLTHTHTQVMMTYIGDSIPVTFSDHTASENAEDVHL